ncbi:MAG: undecaprenyl-diphosphate phosphatase [Patescibacteria group bacterium]|nr:undecaprenyl-diphosphate phosphatase [Patescibacteria group bacterium]
MTISETLYTLIIGAVQGATELLPISSSGHLILISEITSHEIGLIEIAFLHIGTLAALVVVSRNKIREILNRNALINILLSIIPAGLIGFWLKDIIEQELTHPLIIILSLVGWGIVMIIVDARALKKTFRTKTLSGVSRRQALTIGLGQALALIPGTSRSGITTITGIAVGLDPATALSFSFLSGIPLIASSGLYSLIKINLSQNSSINMSTANIILATIISFGVGIAAAWILKRFIKKRILTLCGIYRIILGILLITLI